MSFNILSPTEVANMVRKVFNNAPAKCNSLRTIADIKPPANSSTAKMIFETILRSNTEVNVAFIDEGDESVVPMYEHNVKTVFIRTDKTYVLTEYADRPIMDFTVLLYHEFGHAKQDIEGDLARLVKEDSSGIPIGGTAMGWENGVKVAKIRRGKTSQYVHHGFAVNVETNNMRRHEWPMSMEMGLPRRSEYKDLQEV